jgi:hypothetical protein
MDGLKEAGKLVNGMGTRARLMIMGVMFPGLLITCELIWLYLSWNRPNQSILGFIIDALGELKPLVGFVFIVVGLAVSCAVGYLNRDGSFWVSNFWLRKGWPPPRNLPTLFERLRLIYGGDSVNQVLAKYGVFGLVEASQDAASKLPRLPESYVREFCKLWLVDKRPTLSTEATEVEINVVMGLDDRFHESCHKRGIHLGFRSPI